MIKKEKKNEKQKTQPAAFLVADIHCGILDVTGIFANNVKFTKVGATVLRRILIFLTKRE